MASGRLMGIARHARPRGPMEVLESITVSIEGGLQGDFRGAVRPGRKPRRQVSLIEAESWAAALADLGSAEHQTLDWWHRRANLLTQGLRLPRAANVVIQIGDAVQIETTTECDPCSRMDEIAPGLKAALLPDWRGGVLGRVLAEGPIKLGDEIRIVG